MVKLPSVDFSKAGIPARVIKTEQKEYDITVEGQKRQREGVFLYMEGWDKPTRYGITFAADGSLAPSCALAKLIQRLQKLGLITEAQARSGGVDLDSVLINKNLIWNSEMPWNNKKGTGLETTVLLPTAEADAHTSDAAVAPTTGGGSTEATVNTLVQVAITAGKPISPQEVLNLLARDEHGGGNAVEQWLTGGLKDRMLQTSLELRADGKLYPRTVAAAPQAA